MAAVLGIHEVPLKAAELGAARISALTSTHGRVVGRSRNDLSLHGSLRMDDDPAQEAGCRVGEWKQPAQQLIALDPADVLIGKLAHAHALTFDTGIGDEKLLIEAQSGCRLLRSG